jgi:hypothetical protein
MFCCPCFVLVPVVLVTEFSFSQITSSYNVDIKKESCSGCDPCALRTERNVIAPRCLNQNKNGIIQVSQNIIFFIIISMHI